MPTIDDLRRGIGDLLGQDDRPILLAAALWPLPRVLPVPAPALPGVLTELLIEVAGPRRTLVMPTLTTGLRDGFCDLDTAPSTTGALTEHFRRQPGVRRTRSVYSSYAALGPDRDDFVGRPIADVWGDGSSLHWLEARDAHLLMLATHPTHCVYLHRVEWLARVSYRYPKVFRGRMRWEGREEPVEESFFVRSLAPEAVNDFTGLLPRLVAGGMRVVDLDGVRIAHMRCHAMRDHVLAAIREDPFICLANPEAFRAPS